MVAKRASSSSKAGTETKKQRSMTPAQLASVKLRDTYKHFTPEETDIITDSTGKTLRQKLIHDITLHRKGERSGNWGKLYHDDNKKIFKKGDQLHLALKPSDSSEEVRPAMLKAILRSAQAWMFKNVVTCINAYLAEHVFRCM